MPQISGYAARFGVEAVIAGEFRERLAPGAFAKTLTKNDVVALLDHDSGRVLGRKSVGTLTLKEDRIGLWYSLDVDETTPEGQSALGTVRRGDVSGCSFGFRVKAERWEDGGRRLPLRIIDEVDLFEITLTCMPAYSGTSAAVVSSTPISAAAARAESAMRARGLI